ncbi:uncharacterized protein K452DRAFT_278947 [Aplosporella prunicola CBS 121167]|uniref:NAD(P)-binding domain-containing protein n=1 Tax=Aplosporella prunicola CBS 121167 TaxID=1176127 RepID=A0A6A6AYY0_9PEZI|nr:uncharacterized protein K452DRAFT_278947 [Aplosporella prunicola CBS 121167]KAF2137139.1 hypothetical protein K452DRAFT_278947 [Aplosporella prunicola CBS 121167]
MTTTPPPTIAFFGATGGCASHALALALKAGYKATALARTPDKLRTQLLSAPHNLPETLLSSALTIIAGDATSTAAVRATLTVPGTHLALAASVVSGIGSVPALSFKNPLFPVTLQEPHVCETAARTLVDALRALLAEGYAVPPHPLLAEPQGRRAPRLLVISSTGISAARADVPSLLVPVYYWLLDVPIRDKAALERVVLEARKEGVLDGLVVVRPPVLVDGEGRGLGAVREGPGPAVGYRIARSDVGAWIWEEGVLKGREWSGRCVTITW